MDGKKMYEKYDKLLKERNLTNYAVSKATGIPRSSLQDWKTGRSVPKLDKLLKVSQFLGVSIAYLLE